MKCVILLIGSQDESKLTESMVKQCSFMQFTHKLTSDVTHIVVPNKIVDITNVDVISGILRMLPVISYQCKLKLLFLSLVFPTLLLNSVSTVKTTHI